MTIIAITGATGDAGYTCIKMLCAEAEVTKILFTCRTKEKAERVLGKLLEETGKKPSFFSYVILDLDDIASITAAVKSFPKVDYLVLNAGGLGYCKIHEASGCVDGVVSNVLGHSVLSDGLLKAKKIKTGGRIVYVGSEVSRPVRSFTGLLPNYLCFGESDIDWAMSTNYDADCGPLQTCCCLPVRQQLGDYKNAKILGQLFYLAVAKEQPDIYTVTVSPGAVLGSFGEGGFFPLACMTKNFGCVFRCVGIAHPMESGVQRYIDLLTGEPKFESGSMILSSPNCPWCCGGWLWGAQGPVTDNRKYTSYLADEELAAKTAAVMRDYQARWIASAPPTKPQFMLRNPFSSAKELI